MAAIASPMNPRATDTTSRQFAWLGALLVPAIGGPIWVAAATGGRVDFSLAATLTGFVVIATALVASYTDIRWHVIPNWVTYSAALWGVGINLYEIRSPDWQPGSADVFGAVHFVETAVGWFENLTGNLMFFEPIEPEPQLNSVTRSYLGTVGIGASLAGLFLLFTLMLIVFSITGGGAGDVKLAGAIGALLGFELGAEALLYAFVTAGIAIALWALGSIGPVTVVRLLARRFGGPYFPKWINPSTEQDRKILTKSIPLGPFFAVGMLIVVTGFNRTIESWLPGG
ncbi:MAG: A24 family peptidase [Pirellulales bacterium]